MVKCLHFILLNYVGIDLRGALVLILSLRPKFKAFTVTVGCLDIYYDTKYSLTVFYFRVNWTALTWWDVNLTSDLRGVRDSSRRSPRALLIARCDQLFLEVLNNKVGTHNSWHYRENAVTTSRRASCNTFTKLNHLAGNSYYDMLMTVALGVKLLHLWNIISSVVEVAEISCDLRYEVCANYYPIR